MIPLLTALVVVTLIYLLRPPARRVIVPSTVLWQLLVERSARRKRWLRWLASLALSALLVAIVTSVLFGVQWRPASLVDPVLLIDNTGSMAARTEDGGTTRLDLAKLRALGVISRATGTITVADLAGTVGPTKYRSLQEARRAVESIEPEPAAEARIPDQLRVTEPGGPEPQIFLFSDDVDRVALPSTLDGVNLNRVDTYRDADNLGILVFDATSTGPSVIDQERPSAYLEIANGGSAPQRGRLTVDVLPAADAPQLAQAMAARAGPSTEAAAKPTKPATEVSLRLLQRDLDLGIGERWDAALDLERAYDAFPGQDILVRSRIALITGRGDGIELVSDAQSLDDESWLVLSAPAVSVVALADSNLPRWLRRLTDSKDPSGSVARGRSQKDRARTVGRAVMIATRPSESVNAPCLILPPRLDPSTTSATTLPAEQVELRLPHALPISMPWTEVVVPTNPVPGLSRGAAAETGDWLVAKVAREPASAGPSGAVGGVSATAEIVVLVSAPGVAGPCTEFHFDPLASTLETRPEFPALVDRLLLETAAAATRESLVRALGTARQQWLDGRWREVEAEKPFDVAAPLRVAQGLLSARPPLDQRITFLHRDGTREGTSEGTSDAASIAEASPTEESPPWRRPARAHLLAAVAFLLIAETFTRLAGITE